jgi:hypothetical protein
VSEGRSISRAEILAARSDAAAEAAEVTAAEAAAAEEAAAAGVSAAEAAAAAGDAAKAAADTPGARAAVAPELPKEPGDGTGGIAEDAEEIHGRPVFSVGAGVRVLAATAPDCLPRLAEGCEEAIVKAYNPRSRKYTAKAFACTRGCRP